jgi:hypothetical protein
MTPHRISPPTRGWTDLRRPYCVAVIYLDDAVEIEVLAADSGSAMDEAFDYAVRQLRPGFTEIVLICEPEQHQSNPIQPRRNQ